MIQNEEYLVHPVPMKGKDGNMYNVFTFYASGRSWAGKQYYIRDDNSDRPIKVKVLPRGDAYLSQKDVYRVELLDSTTDKVKQFKKSPYVRKDGSFAVVDDVFALNTFGKVYGVLEVTLRHWEGADNSPGFIKKYYPELAEVFKEGTHHYVIHMHLPAGTARNI